MNRRNPTLSGGRGGAAVGRLKSTGWGPGEHGGPGSAIGGGWGLARRCCQAPDLRTDLCGSDYPAAKCCSRPCPGYFDVGSVECATAEECAHFFWFLLISLLPAR